MITPYRPYVIFRARPKGATSGPKTEYVVDLRVVGAAEHWREELIAHARKAWRRNSSDDTVRQIGIILGLLGEDYAYVMDFACSPERTLAYGEGYEMGRAERRGRLIASGMDEATATALVGRQGDEHIWDDLMPGRKGRDSEPLRGLYVITREMPSEITP